MKEKNEMPIGILTPYGWQCMLCDGELYISRYSDAQIFTFTTGLFGTYNGNIIYQWINSTSKIMNL